MSTTLTESQVAKLTRLYNRRSAHELVLDLSDGRRLLVCYASGSPSIRTGWSAIVSRVPDLARILHVPEPIAATYDRDKRFWVMDKGAVIRWSRRTQREAIMAGEHEYIGRVTA